MSNKDSNASQDVNEDIAILESIFEQTEEISEVSYQQEIDRSKQLLLKSDYLVKYISVIIVFLNIFLPFAISKDLIDIQMTILLYVLVSVPLLGSLFFSIRAQILQPGKFFPTGKTVLLQMKREPSKFCTGVKIKNRKILYYSSATESMQSSNDTRARYIKKAYKFYMGSIFILFGMMIIILIIA